jgi:chemotaxis-related protein WspB
MLLLMFRAGESDYALDAARVVEVIPRVDLRPIPHAPAFVAGLLGYRGRVVPVIDFSLLVGAAASTPVLSTRVVLARFMGHDHEPRLVGLAAEDVSHVVTVDRREVVAPAMQLEEAPFLGEVVRHDGGLIQLVLADKLLSERMQDALYGTQLETQTPARSEPG